MEICLFRSIAHQLVGDDSNHNFYRALAVVHMRARKSHYEGFIYDFGFAGTFEEYLDEMAEDGQWGGQTELVALSTVLNCKIILLKETKETIVVDTSQNNNDTKTLHLAFYQKKSHYFSLVKNEQINEPRISTADEIEARRKVLVKTNDQSSSKLRTEYAKKNSNSTNEKLKNFLHEEIKIKKNVLSKQISKGEAVSNNCDPKNSNGPDFTSIFNLSQKDLILWCVNIGFIIKPRNCKTCRNKANKINDMRLSGNCKYIDKFVWRCKDKGCGEIKNIRENNILLSTFRRIKLKMLLIYIFTHFSFMVPASVSCKTLRISLKNIRELSVILSNWIVSKQIESEDAEKFGGPYRIIEMDESCFFKRKYNKGRRKKQVWGFGLVDRTSGRFFAQVVNRRDEDTLVPIVQKYVHKNTDFVITDEWKPYQKLKKLGFNHESLKHKTHFVRPDDNRIHTQTIENRWSQIKSLMKKHGKIRRINFESKINPLFCNT